MARRAKPSAAPAAGRRIPGRADVEQAFRDIASHQGDAAEASGLAGQASKTFADRFGLNKKAVRYALSLFKLDPDKRQASIRDALTLITALGYLEQSDMFDDLKEPVAKITAQLDAQDEADNDGRLVS